MSTTVTVTVTLIQFAVFPLLMSIVHTLNQTNSEVHGKATEFNDAYVLTTGIICEQELILVGICFTRANDSSDIAVYGLCPYITFSDK